MLAGVLSGYALWANSTYNGVVSVNSSVLACLAELAKMAFAALVTLAKALDGQGQFGQGAEAHFAHDVVAMHFDRAF